MIALVDALALLRKKRALVWLALHELLALALCLHPGLRRVFGTPGFEFAFAQCLLAALSMGHLGAMAAARVREAGPSASASALVARGFGAGFLAACALLGLPLATVLVAGLWNGVCHYGSGLAFFALLPATTAVLGVSVGLFFGLFFTRRFAAYLAYLALALGSLAASVAWLMLQAPIFAYDPFFGHFPGALYDELLVVRAPLLAFRAETLLGALAFLLAAAAFADPAAARLRRSRTRVGVLLASLAFLGGAGLLRAHGADLGYFVSTDDVARSLGGRVETAHFVLHYPRQGPIADRIGRVAVDHEFRYEQLRRWLGAEPTGKVHAFLYADVAQKAALMGARHVSIAKPWLRQLHLHDMGFPHPLLRHELAHVFGAATGAWFGVSARNPLIYNVGLIEGLAVAADWSLGPLTGHEWSKAAFELLGERAPSVERMLGVTGFWSESGALAYTLCGSFVRHLAERYGAARVRDVYSDGDFARAYGRPLGELASEWRARIDAVPLDAAARRAAELRFLRPSLFRRACGHEVARLSFEAAVARSAKDLKVELGARERAAALEPEEAGHAIALADAYRRAGRSKDARALLDAEIARREGEKSAAQARARLREERADLDWRENRIGAAARAYGELLKDAPPPDDARRLTVKRVALDHDVAREPIRRLFLEPQRSRDDTLELLRELSLSAPTFLVGRYLYGRHLYFAERYAAAGRELQVAAQGSLPGLELGVEAKRLYAYAALWLGDFGGAERAFRDVAVSRMSEAMRLEAEDGLERARFTRAYLAEEKLRAGRRAPPRPASNHR